MRLDEAKKVLEDNGYMINEETHYDHDARIDTSKLETKLKEMEQDLKIFSRIGAMIVAYFDREYAVKAECQAIEAIEDYREHVWHIHVWTDSDVDLEINVIDYNDMTLWIEYSVFGKEGGVEAQYSDAKYADLIKTKGSYMNVIDNLIKDGEK